jgi:hypothetical protein
VITQNQKCETLIQTTKAFIFGGFASPMWDPDDGQQPEEFSFEFEEFVEQRIVIRNFSNAIDYDTCCGSLFVARDDTVIVSNGEGNRNLFALSLN